jgi:glycosyltransferase involved in cell wall biosynthesis
VQEHAELVQNKNLSKSNHINFFTERKGWIIRRLVDELLPICKSYRIYPERKQRLYPIVRQLENKQERDKTINYFATYTWFDKKYTSNHHNVSLFTHVDESNPAALLKWKEAASGSNLCIAISKFAYDQVLALGGDEKKTCIIKYGIDHHKYFAKCNLLVVGKPRERKGVSFLAEIVSSPRLHPRVTVMASQEGWGVKSFNVNRVGLEFMYDWCDALLVTSDLEGGHTPTVEALATGKPVLTTRTGWSANELNNIDFSQYDVEAALRVINKFAQEVLEKKYPISKTVESFSWDNWRRQHELAFQEVLGC